MRILVIRHGIAVDEERGLSDDERYLTPEGRAKTRKVAELLAGHGVRVDRILTSPLVRAVQTAEIVAGVLGTADVRASRTLVPGATMASVDVAIAESADAATLALVGHEPSMSAIAAHLLGIRIFPRSFKKAGICAIQLPGVHDDPGKSPTGGKGKFELFVTPKGPTIERKLEE